MRISKNIIKKGPLPQATCCEDQVHCCPYGIKSRKINVNLKTILKLLSKKGYRCNIEDECCENEYNSIKWYTKFSAKKLTQKVEDVQCADGQSECPDGTTCCQLPGGDYGCCPLPKATCCNDQVHCCPNGYTCDVKDGRCNKGEQSIEIFTKFSAKKLTQKVEDVQCADGQSECPDGTTCCQLPGGDPACCPYSNGTCCGLHGYCCPEGYSCDDQNKETCLLND